MLSKREAKALDKFYTKDDVVNEVIAKTKEILSLDDSAKWIEPSAGSGAFSKKLENCLAYDIRPEDDSIIKQDFLQLTLEDRDYIAIGNPPYGSRNGLSIEFVNHASKFCKAIAFVIPITFLKWSVQSHISQGLKLIHSETLEEDSFTFMGDSYSVRTCFQIWVRNDVAEYSHFKDLRLEARPPTTLPEFNIWQHNATEESKRYIDENWKYATWRQGYKDYSHRFTKEKDYDELKNLMETTNLQFFFFEPLTEEAEQVFLAMDFDALSKRNMSTPGFGKGDFVQYYLEKKLELFS